MDNPILNSATSLAPECSEVVENSPSIKETDSYYKQRKLSNKNPTDVSEEKIQILAPKFAENTETVNCVQEISYVDNLIEEECTSIAPNECQPCELFFENLDGLTTHQLAVHTPKVFFCWDCNILVESETEYEAHYTSLHGGKGNRLSALGTMPLSTQMDKPGSVTDVKKTSKKHCNFQNTLFMNCNDKNDEFQETITPLPQSEIEQIGTKIDAEIENKVIIKNTSSVNVTVQRSEGNPTNIDTTKEFFKNTIIQKIRMEFPLKSFSLKKPSKEQRVIAEAIASTSQKRIFPCNFCTKTFSTKYRLVSHKNFHTHELSYSCNACNKLYYSKESLTIHLYTHNDEMKPLSCKYDGCTKRFTKKTLLAAHAQSHSEERNFVCDICLLKFKQMKTLIRHKGTHHSGTLYQCTACSNSYKSRNLLADHMHSHLAARTYKCNECGMAFAQASRRNQHKAVHAVERKYKCHLCSSAFKRASHLSAHIKRHARTHAYKCAACGLPFESLREVSAHRKTHTETELNTTRRRLPARPAVGAGFKCPVCEKLLLTKVTLQNHLTLHTDVKPYQCDLCDQSFTTESNMTNHRVIHSGMKPFPCQYCPEGYMYKEERELHELTHTVVNPYVCEFCNGEFTSKMSLNQHLAVHADVRRHACDFCNQRFRRRDTLDAHIRTHTGERPYVCSFCTQSFKQKGDCTMHERKAHKDQGSNNSVVASVTDDGIR